MAFAQQSYEFVEDVTDAYGTTEFDYQIDDGTRTVSDPRQGVPQSTYTVNPYGATTKVQAPLGKTSTMEWATPDTPRPDLVPGNPNLPGVDAVMVAITDALGRRTEYKYDHHGNVIQETVSFAGQAGSVRPVTEADGVTQVSQIVTSYTYDPIFGKMTSKTDAENHTIYFVYDSPLPGPALPVQAPSATGRTSNLLAAIDALGNMSTYVYASSAGGGHGSGDLMTMTDPRGHVTRYSNYDAYGNAQEIADVDGHHVTQQVFDVRSRLKETTNTFGHHAVYEYDGLDRKVRESRLDDLYGTTAQQTEYQYYPSGQLKQVIDGLGQVTVYHYDDANRLTDVQSKRVLQAVQGGANNHVDLEPTYYGYDEAGNLLFVKDPRGVVQFFTYDALNRRTHTVIATGPSTAPVGINGLVLHVGYNVMGNTISQTDAHGNTTHYFYDGLDRQVEIQLPVHGAAGQQATIRAAYDRVGNKVLQTDANGNETRFAYDDAYRLLGKTEPLDNTVKYAYDPSGNVVKETRKSGGVIILEVIYDDGVKIADTLNRPTSKQMIVALGDPSMASDVTYVTTYQYLDSQNRVITIGPRGNDPSDNATDKVEEQYDGLDRLFQQIEDPEGLNFVTQYGYDANGNQISVKDAEGNETQVTFDGLGRKIRVQYPLGFEETFRYDGANNQILHTDKRGIRFTTDYDNSNRVLATKVQQTISDGGQILTLMAKQYDDPANKITVTDANGNATVEHFDGLGRLVLTIDPYHKTVSSTYDGVNKVSDTDKLGHYTKYTYDDLNRLVKSEEFASRQDAGPHTTQTIKYEDDKNRVITTDGREVQQIKQNDSLGRLVQVSRKHPALAAEYGADEVVLEQNEYDGNNNKTLSRDAAGAATKYVYDGAGRLIAMIEALGTSIEATTQYSYDDVGNLISMKDARPHDSPSHAFPQDVRHPAPAIFDVYSTYDALYRKLTETTGDGDTTTYAYDANGNVVHAMEPNGPAYVTHFSYDELGALLSVDETAKGGGITRFTYDNNRNKVAQEDANGNLNTYVFDKLNRLTDRFLHLGVLPDDATALHWHYGFDANNNLTLVIDAKGQETDMVYDYRDRLATQTFSNFADPSLDFQPLSITYAHDGNDNLTSAVEVKQVGGTSVTETCTYAFDMLNQPIGMANYDDKTVQYAYDTRGNRTQVTDADGLTTEYGYDERNRLTTVMTQAGTTTYEYLPNGAVRSIAYPNGTSAEYAYDAAGRVTLVVNRRGLAGAAVGQGDLISSFRYTYDASGNRLAQVESQENLNGGVPQTTAYAYDLQNRLIHVGYGATAALDYTYDLVGNRLTELGNDPADPATRVDRTYAYDRANRLRSVIDNLDPAHSFAYYFDANGNRVAKTVGLVSSSLDAEGQLVVQVANPVSFTPYLYNIRDHLVKTTGLGDDFVTFDYDFSGMRVKKVSLTGETRYLYDGHATLQEYDPSGQTTLKYDYGLNILSMADAATATTQFYLIDGLGSAVNLARADGTIQVSYSYDAWGNTWQSAGVSYTRRRGTSRPVRPPPASTSTRPPSS